MYNNSCLLSLLSFCNNNNINYNNYNLVLLYPNGVVSIAAPKTAGEKHELLQADPTVPGPRKQDQGAELHEVRQVRMPHCARKEQRSQHHSGVLRLRWMDQTC